MEMNLQFWQDKKVFITGHTGFKGSWLALWLQKLGAEVFGFSLERPSLPALYDIAQAGKNMTSIMGDIRNIGDIEQALSLANPDVVIHMAAQTLVRKSYRDPIDTFSTNIMGTVNLLQTVRKVTSVKVVINVTSDKCYENKEWIWGYRESDPMGGYDPYSCSKGCAELITNAFRSSYFDIEKRVAIASARAGNVIGGGDWADDRLVPDIVRAFSESRPAIIRNPGALRPWQHVLEPLSGYLTLAEKLWNNNDDKSYCSGWNFGPLEGAEISVGKLAEQIATLWGNNVQVEFQPNEAQLHEANYLKLDCTKARFQLDWTPRLSLSDTLEWTIAWYKSYYQDQNMRTVTIEQITHYEKIFKDDE